MLAARIAISNLHKETKKTFSQVISDLYHYSNSTAFNISHHSSVPQSIQRMVNLLVWSRRKRTTWSWSMPTLLILPSSTRGISIITSKSWKSVTWNPVGSNLNTSFGFKTLERSYLLRINNRVAERPQHMIMRVAVGIHGEDIDRVMETYNLMSERYFTHASPTLFNAGTPHPQLSSCFLVCMKDDSIEGIYDTLKSCAMISKTAGGIGLNIHCIRATGCVDSYSCCSLFN